MTSYYHPPEFVACILASSVGSRLFPIASEKIPKHMLPVAGIPVLFRMLAALEASGFCETVVALREDDTVTREALLKLGEGKKQQQHPYKVVVDQQDEGNHDNNNERPLVLKFATMKVTVIRWSTPCPGTVEALRRVEASGVISEQSHIVVFPGDLVVLDAEPLRAMIHSHRKGLLGGGGKLTPATKPFLSSACTVLLADVGEVDEQGHPLKELAKQKKGLLARDEEEIDYIAITGDSRLVWKQSKLDVEEDKDMIGTTPKLAFPKARLRGGITRIRTEWNDVHCYCLAPWVRRLLVARKSLQSIQYDLVPLLIARQFRGAEASFGSKVEKEIVDEALQSFPRSSSRSSDPPQPLRESPSSVPLAGNTSASVLEYAVLAHVARTPVFRSHTLAAYLYANREMAHQISAIDYVHTAAPSTPQQHAVLATKLNPCLILPAGASVKPKFHSVLLSECTVADKVTFKSSVVGRSCTLGANCRLNNVVLHDNVTVGDNTILQNTVVGSNSSIAENCNLNDCQVCSGKTLPSGTKKKGEAFTDDSM